ncbi:BON domain-containing protein [Massilia norwichensis]|uniref:BON domain-containing protein n=1 Tax=Massilia norwichensis TaxID=1442366 RepID=A0ABT2A6B4_9BURK|nr:BON domain-containing protein [Massilia norwichensis]MCS0589728.1 BON domain-containing protein [Massilia norwichensis]
MKTLIATLLATAAGAAFAAPTFALNHDPASYRAATQKAAADYKAATAKCGSMSGNDKDVCMAEAKLTRTRTEADALSKYNTSAASKTKARTNLADAEYDVAKTRCDAKSGAEKDDCMNNAKSVHTAALADAKSGANTTATGSSSAGATGSSGTSGSGGGLVASTDKSSAADKCAQGGDAKTGCLVQTKPSTVKDNAGEIANRTENAADRAGDKAAAATSTAAAKTREVAATAADKTKAVAATAAEKTREVAKVAVEKTREVGATVAQKTENLADRAGDKTRDTAAVSAQKTDNALDNAGDKTRDAAAKTKLAASDTAITTKVKAGLVKEPDLESLGIHVETEKGVVMLSGFVNSKAEADKAVKVAKGVEGVSTVKSAIKVK